MAKKILIIDDELSIRDSLAGILSDEGFESVTADSAEEAFKILDEQHINLILLDIWMPGMDGIALALKVAKEHPKTAILMMTGYAAERQRAHNLEELIHEVIAKPFSLKQICDAAEDAMSQRGRRVH